MTTLGRKKFLVTSALPYANGPLHFGHLAGVYIPADIYTRYRRLQGHHVKHICGSDEHGVAIMLNAQKAKMDYQSYVNTWHQKHKELFDAYGVEFDFFGQTSAPYHAEEVVQWFDKLYKDEAIGTKEDQQLFCNGCKNHLPDRFVEGTCYECDYTNARGDECPECGTWIEPVRLKNPVCKICGSKDIEIVTTNQYYLLLSKYHSAFQSWFQTKSHWRKTVVPYVQSLSKDELVDRAISRDLDWGIDVPLEEAKGKKLYVWFDAPIGYVSNMKEHLRQIGSEEHYLKDWWHNKDVQISHFIGKDNIIFHCVIFPVMAMATDFICPPTEMPANQYLTLEGKQFSKSSGHYVDSDRALADFGQDALRYYLTSLIPEMSDSSFTWKQFQARVNNELANNIGNFVNRCLKFFQKNWSEGLEGKYFLGFASSEQGRALATSIKELNALLEEFYIKRGLEKIMSIGQDGNTFFSDAAPWAKFKVNPEDAAQVIAQSSVFIFVVGILLHPYLPHLSGRILSHFGQKATGAVMQEVYAGRLEILEQVFNNGMKVEGVPEGLVAKIDDQVIAQLEEELRQL